MVERFYSVLLLAPQSRSNFFLFSCSRITLYFMLHIEGICYTLKVQPVIRCKYQYFCQYNVQYTCFVIDERCLLKCELVVCLLFRLKKLSLSSVNAVHFVNPKISLILPISVGICCTTPCLHRIFKIKDLTYILFLSAPPRITDKGLYLISAQVLMIWPTGH